MAEHTAIASNGTSSAEDSLSEAFFSSAKSQQLINDCHLLFNCFNILSFISACHSHSYLRVPI